MPPRPSTRSTRYFAVHHARQPSAPERSAVVGARRHVGVVARATDLALGHQRRARRRRPSAGWSASPWPWIHRRPRVCRRRSRATSRPRLTCAGNRRQQRAVVGRCTAPPIASRRARARQAAALVPPSLAESGTNSTAPVQRSHSISSGGSRAGRRALVGQVQVQRRVRPGQHRADAAALGRACRRCRAAPTPARACPARPRPRAPPPSSGASRRRSAGRPAPSARWDRSRTGMRPDSDSSTARASYSCRKKRRSSHARSRSRYLIAATIRPEQHGVEQRLARHDLAEAAVPLFDQRDDQQRRRQRRRDAQRLARQRVLKALAHDDAGARARGGPPPHR